MYSVRGNPGRQDVVPLFIVLGRSRPSGRAALPAFWTPPISAAATSSSRAWLPGYAPTRIVTRRVREQQEEGPTKPGSRSESSKITNAQERARGGRAGGLGLAA